MSFFSFSVLILSRTHVSMCIYDSLIIRAMEIASYRLIDYMRCDVSTSDTRRA